MAVQHPPEIPVLTGKKAEEFIKMAENPPKKIADPKTVAVYKNVTFEENRPN